MMKDMYDEGDDNMKKIIGEQNARCNRQGLTYTGLGSNPLRDFHFDLPDQRAFTMFPSFSFFIFWRTRKYSAMHSCFPSRCQLTPGLA